MKRKKEENDQEKKKKETDEPQGPIPTPKYNSMETTAKMATAGESYKPAKLGSAALHTSEGIC